MEANEANNRAVLTETGVSRARQLIRAHRLAERLLHNVLGGNLESGACEFEHTVTLEVVNSICTLLGHPKECPHGMPIPDGECCRRSASKVESSIIPVTGMDVAKSARVAYVNSQNDQQLHRIDNLQIRPGAVVKLHQRYPSYVIECEGANIAMDERIVSNIFVWKDPKDLESSVENPAGSQGRKGKGWRKRLGLMRNGR